MKTKARGSKTQQKFEQANLWLLGAGGGLRIEGKDSQGIGDGHVHTVMFKMDNQQGPAV